MTAVDAVTSGKSGTPDPNLSCARLEWVRVVGVFPTRARNRSSECITVVDLCNRLERQVSTHPMADPILGQCEGKRFVTKPFLPIETLQLSRFHCGTLTGVIVDSPLQHHPIHCLALGVRA